MLGLFSGDNTGDLGLGEAVLGLEFLLTFMIVLAYLRVSKVTMVIFVLIFAPTVISKFEYSKILTSLSKNELSLVGLGPIH